MKQTLLVTVIAAALALALVGSAAAITIPIAQTGQLPDQGISIITGEIGDPSAIDTISFFSSPSGTIMTSTLYPITTSSCEEGTGKRTLPAKPGDYCIVIDAVAYKFTLTDINASSVDISGAGEGVPITPPSPTNNPHIDGGVIPPTTATTNATADTPIIPLGVYPVTLIIMIAGLAVWFVWWRL